jgi:collagen type VII alpha
MANINPQGVDLTTGLNRTVKAGDTLSDADGSPITGLQGNTGIAGVTGIQGLGATGVAGSTGIQGDTGIGITGDTGIQGVTGIIGNTGISGVTGIQGISGVTVLSAQAQASGTTISFTVPGGTITSDGDMLRVTATANSAGIAPGSMVLNFGGATTWAVPIVTAGEPVTLTGVIVRLGATSQRGGTVVVGETTSGGKGGTLARTWASNQDVQVEITGGSGGAAIIYSLLVEKVSA